LTEIATPVPTPAQPTPTAEAATPATPVASSSAPARHRSRFRRLAATVADTHRAAVPF